MRLVRSLGLVVLLCVTVPSCSPDTATAQATAPAPFDAVLLEFFGTTDTEAYLRSAGQHASELVVECMNKAGFEFEIAAPPTPVPTVDTDQITLEQARRDGFGIISGFRRQVNQTSVPASSGDPNLAYLGTLSSAEIERFFLTLDGEEAEPGQRQVNGGCNGHAGEVAYADWERFFDLLPNFTALGEERDTHPEFTAARNEWRDCMADRGLEYFAPEAIRSDVVTRMRDTVEEIYPGGQVPLVEQDGAFVLDPALDVLLEELTQFERDVAAAHVECTAPLAERFDAVEHEVQQAFVDANRDAIDELFAGR